MSENRAFVLYAFFSLFVECAVMIGFRLGGAGDEAIASAFLLCMVALGGLFSFLYTRYYVQPRNRRRR